MTAEQALNAALSAEHLLAVTVDQDASARARGVLHRQLLHMSRLVEDLLDSSRTSFDGRTFDRRAIDFREVVAQAVEAIEPNIVERGLHLSVTQPRERQMVMGDPTRLQQVVSNLLHNALRYTAKGASISIAVVHAPDGVTLEVRDSGDGIDPEHLSAIFEPFKRQSKIGPS